MKGDFSRNTFNPLKHFSRVLMQQGRVQLDADWNEQVSILLHYLQTLAKDLIGPHGGPEDIEDNSGNVLQNNCGFEIIVDNDRLKQLQELEEKELARLQDLLNPSKQPIFLIGKGRYYVDGVLCENENYARPLNETLNELENKKGSFLVYLDVWERHITCLEDENGNNPSIREVALGGPDTATRAKVVWQVKATNKIPNDQGQEDDITPPKDGRKWVDENWPKWLAKWQPANRGQLKAKGKKGSEKDTNPCITSPESRYRGAENQLYRVEIHTGGAGDIDGTATFKWSRENGSVVFPICEPLRDNIVKLEHLGRDSRFGLKVGDWVEIVDDDCVLQGRAEPLQQVEKIDPINMEVTLKNAPVSKVGQEATKHPLLRRWDQKKGDPAHSGLDVDDKLGAAKIVESTKTWLTLEDGIQIQFQPGAPGATYRNGDYWLIPARTATGDVEWLGAVGNPEPMPPHGAKHHYAPLAIIKIEDGNVSVKDSNDLRCTINKLGK